MAGLYLEDTACKVKSPRMRRRVHLSKSWRLIVDGSSPHVHVHESFTCTYISVDISEEARALEDGG